MKPPPYTRFLNVLAHAGLSHFIRRGGFPEAIELAATHLVADEFRHFAGDRTPPNAHPSSLTALVRRLLLSRNTSLLAEDLRPAWTGFGIESRNLDLIAEKIDAVNSGWPGETINLTGQEAAIRFSKAHAEYVDFLIQAKRPGIIGEAIRDSRVENERRHVGFPVVLYPAGDGKAISNAVWIEPDHERGPAETNSRLKQEWDNVQKSLASQLGDWIREWKTRTLPAWLHAFAETATQIELESAAFGLAMQAIADQQGWPLPFGIGFTGRLDNYSLRPAGNLHLKMLAAREAGVFLLLACLEPGAPMPPAVQGVRVVLLPNGLTIEEMVRQVNGVCAETGFTEYRWRKASAKLCSCPRSSPVDSLDLPDACDDADACPVGFIGRERLLKGLDGLTAEYRNSVGRQWLAIVAPPQFGKTTLLSHWAKRQSAFPVWFSFARRRGDRRKLSDLQTAIRKQVRARFGVVVLAEREDEPADSLESVLESTSAAVDIVVDGLDEAAGSEQISSILSWLPQLPGRGVTVVGSQNVEELQRTNIKTLGPHREDEEEARDAEELIGHFASKFEKVEDLRDFALRLRTAAWSSGLVQRSGRNLAALTVFFLRIQQGKVEPPQALEDVRLAGNLKDYCGLLVKEIFEAYPEHERRAVTYFLAYRAFLDNRPWPVHDLIRFVAFKDDLPRRDADLWSPSGVLSKSVKRLLDFNGTCTMFSHPLLHEAVRDWAAWHRERVAEQFLELVANEEAPPDLRVYAVCAIPGLLFEMRDAPCARRFAQRLVSETPWVHLRLRALADAGEPDAGEPVARLLDDVALLRFGIDESSPLSHDLAMLRASLAAWGYAIDDSPTLIDQWWQAIPGGAECFPSAASRDAGCKGTTRLLVPDSGPGNGERRYSVPSEQLAGAACELPDSASTLLLCATDRGNIAVFRFEGRDIHREATVPVPQSAGILDLVPLAGLRVAALVVSEDGRRTVRTIDVRSGSSSVVPADVQPYTIAGSRSSEPYLIALVDDSGPDADQRSQRIAAIDLHGSRIASAPLPFGDWDHRRPTLVAFSPDTWAVVGRSGPREPSQLLLQRCVWDGRQTRIETIRDPSSVLCIGACPLPGDRLAVAWRNQDEKQTYLSRFDRDGQEETRRPLLLPVDEDQPSRFLRAALRGFLWNCEPRGWHASFGVVLCRDQRVARGRRAERWDSGTPEIWAMALDAGASARSLPLELWRSGSAAISTWDLRNAVGFTRGRVALLFSDRVCVLGPGADDFVQAATASQTRPPTAILGCRRTGELVVCDRIEFDDESHLSNPRILMPGTREQRPLEVPSGAQLLRVTRDGLVLWVSDSRQKLWLDSSPLLVQGHESPDCRPAQHGEQDETVETWLTQIGHPRLIVDADSDGYGNIVVLSTEADTEPGFESGISTRRVAYADPSGKTTPFRGMLWPGLRADRIYAFGDFARLRDQDAQQEYILDLVNGRFVGVDGRALSNNITHLLPIDASRAVLMVGEFFVGDLSERGTLLSISSKREEFVQGIDDMTLSFVSDVSVVPGHPERFNAVTVVRNDRRPPSLRIYRCEFPHTGTVRVLGSAVAVPLARGVSSCRCLGNHVLLGYDSGRLELRDIDDPGTPLAIGYSGGPPRKFALSHSAAGHFLIVESCGELTWYDLGEFAGR